MKVLTTAGLTKLIELSKGTFLDKNNVIDASDALATVALTGSYNDLIDKPTIPAAQQQVDWNASSGITSIANKPTLSAVATSGNYEDLTNKPTIPASVTVDQTYSATSTNAQSGTAVASAISEKQDTVTGAATTITSSNLTSNRALISNDSGKVAVSTTTSTELGYVNGVTSSIQTQFDTITDKIPAAATSSNQLADKAFVNSSINAVAAYYVTANTAGDAFATKAALDVGPYYYDGAARTPTKNDYAIVTADETKDNACTRYAYTGSQWSFQYIVNNSPFTQAQVDAINSEINSTLVTNYSAHIADATIHVTSSDKTTWNGKQNAITGAATTVTSSDLTAGRALISNDNGKIAVSPNVTSTELGYLDGVTSAIQTQLNNKVAKNADITGGTKCKITYDSKGLVTSGADLVEDDIPDLSLSKIKDVTATAAEVNVLDGITASTTELNYVDGVTSAIQTQLDGKQETLVGSGPGQNIKTINNTSLLGSGNIAIDGLPSQTGQDGKFLTTDGTTASWQEVPAGASLPLLARLISDHTFNDVSYLNANTFSWQSGDVYVAAYNHLANELLAQTNAPIYAWVHEVTGNVYYTTTLTPRAGDKTLEGEEITSIGEGYIVVKGAGCFRDPSKDTTISLSKTETIGDITITYALAEDGHKICLPDQESNIIALYEATGAANYYLLDTTNKQFKLPRKQKRTLIQAVKNTDGTWYNLYSDGWVEQGGQIIRGSITFEVPMADINYNVSGAQIRPGSTNGTYYNAYKFVNMRETGIDLDNAQSENPLIAWSVSGYAAESAYASAGMRLEYYYVGNFEQTAIEQTAGLNAELFNGKADLNLMNTASNVDFVIESQLPTAENGYTWYRKYKSGWVEQGGIVFPTTSTATRVSVALPVTMSSNVYFVQVTGGDNIADAGVFSYYTNRTTTGFEILHSHTTSSYTIGDSWQVSGVSAQ